MSSLETIDDYTYRRPQGAVAKIFNRMLGPLPPVPRSDIIEPTRWQLETIRSYRLRAVLLLIAAVGALLSIVQFIPALTISPLYLVINFFDLLFGKGILSNVCSMIVNLAAMLAIGILTGDDNFRYSRLYKFWDYAAAKEEMWFRMGAEDWSVRQRIAGTIAFGLFHVTNWFYPISSLIVVGCVGGVFMAEYLRVFRLTGDTQIATMSSTKFHATYNRFAIIYMFVAIGITIAVTFKN